MLSFGVQGALNQRAKKSTHVLLMLKGRHVPSELWCRKYFANCFLTRGQRDNPCKQMEETESVCHHMLDTCPTTYLPAQLPTHLPNYPPAHLPNYLPTYLPPTDLPT